MGALHLPNIGGELDAAIGDNSGGTDLTLSSPAFAAVGAVASPDYLWICVDPDGIAGAPEWMKLTALTAGGTSGTVTRGEQGSTARAHKAGVEWVHTLAPSEADLLNGVTTFAAAATRTTTQSILNNTQTAITFDTEERDDGGLYADGGVEDRMTVPVGGAGWYLITAWASWDVNGTGERQVTINAVTSGAVGLLNSIVSEPSNPGGVWIHQGASELVYLPEGAVVRLYVFQASGGALNVRAGARLAMARVAA